MGQIKFVRLADGHPHLPPIIEKPNPIPTPTPVIQPTTIVEPVIEPIIVTEPVVEPIIEQSIPIIETVPEPIPQQPIQEKVESIIEEPKKSKTISDVKTELSYPIKFKKITRPIKTEQTTNVESDKDKNPPTPTQNESFSKKDWFVLALISLILISVGVASGWYLSTFDNENYKHKLTQSLSRLEIEKKQTANAVKKNIEIQNEFQNKLASLSVEFVNLKNTYQSNLLAKDTEIKLIKNNLPTNFVFNTITNIVTNYVTNKIPTHIEKFKIDMMKKSESIESSYKKETESEDIDTEKLEKLEKNKKIVEEIITDIDKFKDKNNKDINSFIESKIKYLNSKGIGYGTNKPTVKLK